MNQTSRYLITVDDEKTWKHDRPVIFLGEWCRSYPKRHLWESMDAVVAEPYGVDQKQKEADLALAITLENYIFTRLCTVLNRQHGVMHGYRFWKIVLGHWLRLFVNVLLNRIKTLERCLENYVINGTSVYSDRYYSLATPDSYSAIWSVNDSRWNSVLTGCLLRLLRGVEFPIETISKHGTSDTISLFKFKSISGPESLGSKIRRLVFCLIGRASTWFAGNNDVFVIGSYLPPKEVIKLQLALGQCPQYWRSPKLEINKNPDRKLRIQLSAYMVSDAQNYIESILNSLVFEMLPICYLEGFTDLITLANQQHWPKAPKIVFTSNNYHTDEVFKVWLAAKVESGSKYFAGQHGNNYGTYRYMAPTVEETTADRFLTWGWTDGLAQHTPAFVFKNAGKKQKIYNANGGLLLIEACLEHRINTWDNTIEFADYLSNQFDFVTKLNVGPKGRLTVRLHSGSKYTATSENKRWAEFDASLAIDSGAVGIRKLIAESRLIVHSYDSTGILETLSSNIPTIAFWKSGLDHVRESAQPYYQMLVDAGIVHFTSESAASMVNQVWSDVEFWWCQDEVQNARIKFCERYAKNSVNPKKDLREHFKLD